MNFTVDDMRNAFYAGQEQKSAEWGNEVSTSIGHYEPKAEWTFESWLFDNYLVCDVIDMNQSDISADLEAQDESMGAGKI